MASERDLTSIVTRAAALHRGRALFIVERGGGWHPVTFDAFEGEARRFAAALRNLGVGRGDRVAVVASNRPEWAVGAAAAHAVGAAYVPMYEVQLEKDWRYILEDSGAVVCLASTPAIAAKVEAMRAELPALRHVIGFESDARDATSFRHLVATTPPHASPPEPPAPRDVAAIIYTSGTTGRPKGVLLAHEGFARTLTSMQGVWSPRPGDRAVSILPWAHVGGFFELMTAILTGCALGLPPSLERLPDTLLAVKPTSLVGVPRIWNKFYDAIHKAMKAQRAPIRALFAAGVAAERKRLDGAKLGIRERIARRLAWLLVFPKMRARLGGELRTAVTGAAAMAKEVAAFLECIGITVIEVYGQTEVSAIATANPPGAVRLGTVGKALPGVRITIDPDTVGDDGSGEIILHSPGAMLGYHHLPDETAAVLTPDGGVRTGDLGKLDDEGYLSITGRVREVYKLENGKFVTPVPIEEKLTLSPYIAQAMVHGLNRPHNVALLVADVAAIRAFCASERIDASEPEAMLRHERVRTLVEQEIATHTAAFKGYERVKAFALIAEELTTANDMLTPSLKIKRRNVLQRYGALIESLYVQG